MLGKLWNRLFLDICIIIFILTTYFISSRQDFLSGHSTVYQLIETYDCILKTIDEGKLSYIVFCDLSKAFDQVWHKGLLFKLQTYGVYGNLLKWRQSYLENSN